MVLGGYLNLAGRQILDGVVTAVVSKGKFESGTAQRGRQQLVSETDTEYRHRTEQFCDDGHIVGECRGVTGTIGQEDAVRTKLANSLRAR